MARGERTMTIKFIGDTKSMQRGVKDIVSGLDDAESAGKRYAAALDIMTDKAVQGSKEQRAAIDALAQALGSDTVAAMERAGGSVDQWVAELSRAGLSLDDLRADVDAVADSIRRAESANGTFTDLGVKAERTSQQIDMVRDSSDQSRSVLANMVGNSAQDLGALGGVAGTAGMAIGQLAEYASEGNISMAGLAAVAGPMAGVAIAGAAIAKVMGTIKKDAEQARKETELWASVQEQVVDGQVRDAMGDLAAEYEGTLSALEELGIPASDWLRAMRGQKDLIGPLSTRYEELGSKMANAVDPAHALTEAELDEYNVLSKLIPNLREQIENRDNAVVALDEERKRVDLLTSAYIGQGPVNKELVNQYGRIIDRVDDVGQAMEEVVDDAVDPMQVALDELGAAYDRLKGKFDDRAAWDNANEAAKTLMETVASGEADWTELRQATDDYTLALADVVMSMDNLPTEAKTQFIAQLDAGQVDAVRSGLDALAKPRTAEFQILINAVTSAETKQLELKFNRDINGNGIIGRAGGGPVWPGGVFAVGDNPDGSWNRTTELFVPDSAGSIMSAGDSRGALGGVTNIYATVQVPPTVDLATVGGQVAEALLAHARTSGPVFQTVRS